MQIIPAANASDLRRVLINEEDIPKTKKEILLDLLYEAQGFRFSYHWLIQGIPRVLDAVPANPWDPNTFLPIELKPGYRDDWAGDLGVLYRRRSIKAHLAQYNIANLRFTKFPTTIHQVVEDLINPHLNYPLNTEDFVDGEITDPEVNNLVIQAREDSLIWCDAGPVTVVPPGDDFFVLVKNVYIDGFHPYKAPSGT